MSSGEFNPEVNFWKAFPHLKTLAAFKALYKSDSNRAKKKSSMAMWFVAFCYDPASPLADEDTEGEYGSKRIVGRDYAGDAEYFNKNEVLLEPVIEYFQLLTETPAIRSMKLWQKKMRERDAFIMATPYSMGRPDENGKLVGDTAADLDKMLANTAKLYDQLAKVQASLEEEKSNKRSAGGAKASASESGKI